MVILRNSWHQKCEPMLTQDSNKNTRNEYFLGQQIAYRSLGKYERLRESSSVSENESNRMVDSAVGSRSPSDEDDLHTHPT